MATTTMPATAMPTTDTRNPRLRSVIRGRTDDPAWARPLLIALLAGTALAYLLNLTESGYANSFYAAAVEAGTKSWKAFLFGSLDSSNFITVDKPPASLWVMELSGRLFGFSSASMLVPQVLEGVISVGLLAAGVKRWFGAGAGLLAGAILAVTPVAALMFRFNNPDALLVCLLVASAYCLVRALEGGSTRWMLGVGALLGFAFLAKMMQAFLVIPGFALVYLVAAPVDVRRRATQLVAGGVALVVSGGWWVALVALWPAASRPMIDGSPDNSILNLIWDYNGFGRLSGGTGGANFSGSTGVFRLFNDLMGGQASWLLPAALVVLVGGLAWRLRAPRTDRTRAALLLWGGWLVVTAAVFSFSSGVIHTYYTVALAPAIAALVGIGAGVLWRRRGQAAARVGMAVIVAVTAGWAIVLLHRSPSWQTWLTPLIVVSGLTAILGLLAPGALVRMLPEQLRSGRLRVVAATAAVIACLAAPVAYSAETISTAHTGSLPSAGPAVDSSSGGFGGFGGGGGGFGGGGGASTTSSALDKALEADASKYRWVAATSGSQSAASLELATGGDAVMAIGGFSGLGGNITLAKFEAYVKAGEIHYYIADGGGAGGFGGAGASGFGGSAAGGFGDGGVPSGTGKSAVSSLFGGSETGSGRSAGTTGRPGASSTGAFGGPGRSGGAAGGPGGTAGGGPGGSGSTTESITSWVEAHYKSVTIGGETVYNLTEPK
jgi:4-amino-4-deoxy-L-arabinose transferase-like glycosyltransferase